MPTDLSPDQARRIRWSNQLLGGSESEPADVVRHGGAWQGQNLPAVLRAIAVRSAPGTTVDDVRRGFDSGRIIRSWPMRGTLFVTTPETLAAMLPATAERTHRAAARRREELGLQPAVVERARDLLRDALEHHPRTRADVIHLWEAAGIATADGRGYHLLAHTALDGLFHWGRFAPGGREQLLELSAALVPLDPGQALAGVARAYVAARGPVTPHDMAWWTGLPIGQMRRVAATVDDLVDVTVAGQDAWVLEEHLAHEAPPISDVTLVPAFDEWILGYKDRSLVASPTAMEAVLPGKNGVFRPAILADGVVVGTWTKTPSGGGGLTAELVEDVPRRTREAVHAAVAAWPHD